MDGVIYRGGEVILGAVEFVRRLRRNNREHKPPRNHRGGRIANPAPRMSPDLPVPDSHAENMTFVCATAVPTRTQIRSLAAWLAGRLPAVFPDLSSGNSR